MKIARISAYQVDLPLHEGSYKWSGGKSVEVFDSTVVRVETDEGLVGWGETCPLGPVYLPSYAAGVRAGIAELAPSLVGEPALELERLNRTMDRHLKGHPYAKAGLDVACWDLLGKAAGQSVCTLLGGRYGDDVILYRAISQDAPDRMAASVAVYREEGYRRFQLKVGSGVEEDVARIHAVAEVLQPGDVLVADANTGWLPHEAARVVRGVRDVDVYVEQPCATYEECLTIRRRTNHPFVLDESVDGLDSLLRAHADGAMDVANVKISKFGGLTRARQARDLCVSIGIAMTLEDTWGGDIVTAAIAHMAHSTPEELRFTATDFNSYVTVDLASGAPRRAGGRMAASTAPGLGVEPLPEVLGDPVLDVSSPDPMPPLRLAVWSGPRNVSTALMRSFESRADSIVCDEPLYAHYLAVTGLEHPMAAGIVRRHESDWRKVADWLTGPLPAGASLFYQKHMAHHLLPEIDRGWLAALENAFLIRDPRQMLTSLLEILPEPGLADTGYPQQVELFEAERARTGRTPVVIDSKELLRDPRGILTLLCERVGIRFEEAMLGWAPGLRETNGCWAEAWYGNALSSTGFAPYREKDVRVPERFRALEQRCVELYDRMYPHRLTA